MRPFRCREIERHLHTASITDPAPPELARHMAGCERCRREWSRLQATCSRLSAFGRRGAEEGRLERGPDAVLRRIRSEQLASGRRGPGWAVGLAGATVVVAAAIATFGAHPRRGRAGTPAAGGHVASASTAGARRAGPAGGILTARSSPAPDGSPGHETPRQAVATPGAAVPSNGGETNRRRTARGRLRRAVVPPTETPERPPAGRGFSSPRGDDLAYVNAPGSRRRDPSIDRSVADRLRQGDDFVTIPLPRLAAADGPATAGIIAGAVKQYNAERAIVDDRLFRKIDVAMPAGDLGQLMALLSNKTHVSFEVGPDLADIKLTVLVTQAPARDLMRQVARLFAMEWTRSGEEGHYVYRLTQTLKQRLAQEEMRRKDDDEMLLDVVNEMEPYLQYRGASTAELKALQEQAAREAAAAGSVEARQAARQREQMFGMLSRGVNSHLLDLYSQLTPEQLIALRNGQTVDFKWKGDGSENSLRADWADQIRQAMIQDGLRLLDGAPSDKVSIGLGVSLDRRHPDRVGLVVQHDAGAPHGRIGSSWWLLDGQPDRLRDPANEKAHAALAGQPEWKQKVDLEPQPDSPLPAAGHPDARAVLEADATGGPGLPNAGGRKALDRAASGSAAATDPSAWIDSADFFSELHRKTGRNLVADYYTRIYMRSQLSAVGGKLLDVLNNASDVLKSEWEDDGGFIRVRRFNYYSERTMDVPNRLLSRWKAARERDGYLHLDSLAEIAALDPTVLDHGELARALEIRYGLDEWRLARTARDTLLFYAALSPDQRTQSQSTAGLRLADLTAAQAELFRKTEDVSGDLPADRLAEGRLYFHQSEPGTYAWLSMDGVKETEFPFQPQVSDRSREKAQAALVSALKLRPGHAGPAMTSDPAAPDNPALRGPSSIVWAEAMAGGEYHVSEYVGGSSNGSTGSFSDKPAGTVLRRIDE